MSAGKIGYQEVELVRFRERVSAGLRQHFCSAVTKRSNRIVQNASSPLLKIPDYLTIECDNPTTFRDVSPSAFVVCLAMILFLSVAYELLSNKQTVFGRFLVRRGIGALDSSITSKLM